MTIDYGSLPGLFAAAVPFAGFLGIEYDTVSPGEVVLRLADDPAKHNHIGTLHAGALFALAESASGLAVIAAIADRLAGVTPLAARAEITYAKVARGDGPRPRGSAARWRRSSGRSTPRAAYGSRSTSSCATSRATSRRPSSWTGTSGATTRRDLRATSRHPAG